jgi:microcin C transport system substrate-binding protein
MAPALGLNIGAFLARAGASRAGPTEMAAVGISTFGDIQYPAGFKRFDYVNPDAPKGGVAPACSSLARMTASTS